MKEEDLQWKALDDSSHRFECVFTNVYTNQRYRILKANYQTKIGKGHTSLYRLEKERYYDVNTKSFETFRSSSTLTNILLILEVLLCTPI